MELPLILTTVLMLAGWALAFTMMRKAARLEGATQSLNEEIERITQDIQAYQARADAYLEAEKRAGAMQQQIKTLLEEKEQRQKDLQSLEVRFENLAHRIFEEKNKVFSERSQQHLQALLNPLKERIGEFQKKVDETYGQHAKEQHHLKHEIARIIEVNQAMKLQTENLTNALKGDVKAQGNWGEIILEKVLETSGLRKDEHYTLQGEGMGLKHVESGGHLRPDVIIHLPEKKHLIIDSKVSLTHYERYIGETDETARALHLKAFVQSIRSHVSGLESKRYQDSEGIDTPDFVLMFMPIESAYALAVQTDRELHAYAWDKRIYFVSPSTLFPILHTVGSLWRMDLQNKNAQEIARQGGSLYDKVAGFITDMQKLGDQLHTARGTYDRAMNKLSEGRGNILRQTEQLRELGAKTSKKLPSELLSAQEEVLS